MTDKQAVARIMGLKDAAEGHARTVARLEATAEAAEARVVEFEDALRQHGLDPAGDLGAQLEQQAAEVETELGEIADKLAEVRSSVDE